MADGEGAGKARVPGPSESRAVKGRQPKAVGRIGAPVPDAGEGVLEHCLEELIRGWRHSAVGRRVRGLVHQMNTPLQVLSFQVELLEQKAGDEAELIRQCPVPQREKLESLHGYRLEKLRQFRREVEKLQALTRRLILQGVHEENQERLYLDLNQVYREELDLYQADPVFQHQVDKEFRFDPALPPIYGYYVDFSQSFRHLVDHALAAMEAAPQRKLTVETRFEEGWRVLRVGDTGAPIPAALLPRLFEPFFSPRGTEESPWAGLGLFLARRLLAPYGGRFQVNSREGETWVTVRLPV